MTALRPDTLSHSTNQQRPAGQRGDLRSLRARTPLRAIVLVGALCGFSDARPAARVAGDGAPSGPVLLGPGAEDAALLRCMGTTAGMPAAYWEVEPHAAVDPRNADHVVAAWMMLSPGGHSAIRAAVSTDGGRTWARHRTLPVNACATGPVARLTRSSDPWVAFGADGRVYVSAIAFQASDPVDSAGAVIVVASGDGGQTWDPPVATMLTTVPRFIDNTSLAAHPTRSGTAFALTTQYRPNPETVAPRPMAAPALLSSTTDGGRTWSYGRAISPVKGGIHSDCPQMVIDPRNGNLYVLYTGGVGGETMSLLRSEDGGATWSAPIAVSNLVPLENAPRYPGTQREIGVAPDIAHLAIDGRTGALFVVFTDGRFTKGAESQVAIAVSTDGGKTWGDALRLSTGAAGWRPSIAVSGAGTVSVTYLAPDTAQAATDSTLPVALIQTTLRARGAALTAGAAQRLDAFTWRPRGDSYFLGDYFALLAFKSGTGQIYARSEAGGARVAFVNIP
jgi:hypothetical protein